MNQLQTVLSQVFLALTIVIQVNGMTLSEFESLEINSQRKNDPECTERPYIIMVSLDGFRHDYAERYQAKNLLKIAQNGASIKRLIPSFPSKTFPNHYSIATGMYPSNHGIIANQFISRNKDQMYQVGNSDTTDNGTWYNGVPIWNLAEKNGLLSASVFWVGTEADIDQSHPNYYYRYNNEIPYDLRIQKALKWLKLPEDERPHLITLYFSLTDTIGHQFGPESNEIAEAVQEVDGLIGTLQSGLAEINLPVTLIVTSDHGMTAINPPTNINDLIDLKNNTFIGGPVAFIYTENESETDRLFQELSKVEQFNTYKKNALPNYLNFRNKDRLGDIVIISEAPNELHQWVEEEKNEGYSKGTHGYDPYSNKDMSGIFYIEGPRVKKGFRAPPIENIHIYPLIAHLLDLSYTHEIDGNFESIKMILDH